MGYFSFAVAFVNSRRAYWPTFVLPTSTAVPLEHDLRYPARALAILHAAKPSPARFQPSQRSLLRPKHHAQRSERLPYACDSILLCPSRG